MANYTSSIVVHGLVIPGLILGVLLGGAYYGNSRFQEEADNREAMFQKMKQDEAQSVVLTAKVTPFIERLNWWKSLVNADQYEGIGEVLGRIEADTPGDQLNREKFRKEPLAQFSPEIKTPTERFTVGFKGRYGRMQTSLLALETQRPNLLLIGMTLGVRAADGTTSAPRLTSELTYEAFIADPQQ